MSVIDQNIYSFILLLLCTWSKPSLFFSLFLKTGKQTQDTCIYLRLSHITGQGVPMDLTSMQALLDVYLTFKIQMHSSLSDGHATVGKSVC